MPIKVADLEKGQESSSIRGKTLQFLKKNPELAYTLKEIHANFSKEINHIDSKVLYKLIYNYLREFTLKKSVIHKGNYYYFNKKEDK
ncbi:MAG: hypothetical protein AABW58_03715 [Nanoarchaeota archaeon]